MFQIFTTTDDDSESTLTEPFPDLDVTFDPTINDPFTLAPIAETVDRQDQAAAAIRSFTSGLPETTRRTRGKSAYFPGFMESAAAAEDNIRSSGHTASAAELAIPQSSHDSKTYVAGSLKSIVRKNTPSSSTLNADTDVFTVPNIHLSTPSSGCSDSPAFSPATATDYVGYYFGGEESINDGKAVTGTNTTKFDDLPVDEQKRIATIKKKKKKWLQKKAARREQDLQDEEEVQKGKDFEKFLEKAVKDGITDLNTLRIVKRWHRERETELAESREKEHRRLKEEMAKLVDFAKGKTEADGMTKAKVGKKVHFTPKKDARAFVPVTPLIPPGSLSKQIYTPKKVRFSDKPKCEQEKDESFMHLGSPVKAHVSRKHNSEAIRGYRCDSDTLQACRSLPKEYDAAQKDAGGEPSSNNNLNKSFTSECPHSERKMPGRSKKTKVQRKREKKKKAARSARQARTSDIFHDPHKGDANFDLHGNRQYEKPGGSKKRANKKKGKKTGKKKNQVPTQLRGDAPEFIPNFVQKEEKETGLEKPSESLPAGPIFVANDGDKKSSILSAPRGENKFSPLLLKGIPWDELDDEFGDWDPSF